MPISDSDPRVFFAAERTLLAWLRTGITIMALGFVVSRFGLFIQLLATQSKDISHSPNNYLSAILGISFVIVGTLTIIVAGFQHKRYIATLPEVDLPQTYSGTFAVFLAFLIGILGIVLASYLLLQA